MLASRSAMPSESSAKAGSNALRGNGASPSPASRAESRKDDRDDGLRGVVGREDLFRELGRLLPVSWWSLDMLMARTAGGQEFENTSS